MGWWGQFYHGKLTMQEVKKMIEKDTLMTVTSLHFGYAVCVVDEQAIEKHEHWRKYQIETGKNPLNYLAIALWRKDSKEVMIKVVGEESGPCEYNVPLKYINAPCEMTSDSEWANNWRQKVRDNHQKNKNNVKLMRSMCSGDRFFVYGNPYKFEQVKNSKWCYAKNLNNGMTYRIKATQIALIEKEQIVEA